MDHGRDVAYPLGGIAILTLAGGDARSLPAQPLGVHGRRDVTRPPEALVEIPNAGGRYSTKILSDPEAVFRTRDHVARAIEELRR